MVCSWDCQKAEKTRENVIPAGWIMTTDPQTINHNYSPDSQDRETEHMYQFTY